MWENNKLRAQMKLPNELPEGSLFPTINECRSILIISAPSAMKPN